MTVAGSGTTGVAETPLQVGSPPSVRTPLWFDLVALAGPVCLAVYGSIGLLLAILGFYSWWLTLLLGSPAVLAMLVGAGLVRLGRPDESRLPHRPRSGGAARNLAAVAALLLAGVYLVFAGWSPSQNIVASRDPGVYLNTAQWLGVDGGLEGDAAPAAFDGVVGLRFDSAGAYNMGAGRLEFQFSHLSSVVMSIAEGLGGEQALFRMPAVAGAVGLLALYAVAVRVTRRPVIALLAPAILAVSMPLLYVSRNTYSEPFTLAMLWGACLALAELHRRPRLTMALVGGVLLGALVSTRVDALLYVALVFPLAALSLMAPGSSRDRRSRGAAWAAVVVAASAVAAVGLVDLFVWTGIYVDHLRPQLRVLWLATGASLAVSLVALAVWRWVPFARRLYTSTRSWLGVAAGVLTVGVLAAGWLLRPTLQVVRGSYVYELVESIQRREGVAIDATRTFAEQSLRWMGWYLGEPTLVAAILGIGLTVCIAIRRGARPATVGVLVLTLASGLLYWWNPSITPDQPWASRRFVPAVLPGLAVMAVVMVAALHAWLWAPRRARRGAAAALVALLAVVLLVPPAARTWPVRWQRAQDSHAGVITDACGQLPDDAAVMVVGGFASVTLSQTLRAWCDVPVAWDDVALDVNPVATVAEQVDRNGYSLVLVAADPADLDPHLDGSDVEIRTTRAIEDRWLVQATVDRPPDSYADPSRAQPAPGPFRLYLLSPDGD